MHWLDAGVTGEASLVHSMSFAAARGDRQECLSSTEKREDEQQSSHMSQNVKIAFANTW
jgi:hypothetical protein